MFEVVEMRIVHTFLFKFVFFYFYFVDVWMRLWSFWHVRTETSFIVEGCEMFLVEFSN